MVTTARHANDTLGAAAACPHDGRYSWACWRADLRENRSEISKVALAVYRAGHALWARRAAGRNPLWVLYKVIDLLLVKLLIGADLPASACVGPGLILQHGGKGVMLNENVVIGADVELFHEVTVGWKEVRDRHREHPVPSIGDGVVVGAGAKVLGDITIGNGAIVGANAVVLRDVPPGAVVAGVPASVVRQS
ncbi:MAG: serine acetyltransferase [Acidimicrobiia bacterium]|nr:serine acetyltransferase [Acidimicrobiia bacterium]